MKEINLFFLEYPYQVCYQDYVIRNKDAILIINLETGDDLSFSRVDFPFVLGEPRLNFGFGEAPSTSTSPCFYITLQGCQLKTQLFLWDPSTVGS